jgi:hypothetical protein
VSGTGLGTPIPIFTAAPSRLIPHCLAQSHR